MIIYYLVMQSSLFYIFCCQMIENDNIAIQMRKGILEYLILLIISKGEVYASDIISHLKNHDLLVVEGTLYPMLSRLKKEQLLTYSWIESPSGPPRKYYSLTSLGFETMKRMESVRNQLNSAILSTQSMKKSGF